MENIRELLRQADTEIQAADTASKRRALELSDSLQATTGAYEAARGEIVRLMLEAQKLTLAIQTVTDERQAARSEIVRLEVEAKAIREEERAAVMMEFGLDKTLALAAAKLRLAQAEAERAQALAAVAELEPAPEPVPEPTEAVRR